MLLPFPSVKLLVEKKDFQEIKPFRIGIPELTHDFDVPSEDRSVIPYAQQTFTGYRLLHEYFSFPDRFFFVDIEGLHQFKASQEGHPFEIKITFNRKLSAEYKPKIKDILLHCTPIVNLFERSTEEVPVNQRMPEYYVIPDMDRRKSKEIYSVNKVTGVSENKLQQYLYMPITSYDVLDTADPEYEYKRFYSTTTRPHPADMSATHIRIFGPSMELDIFPKETLSIMATLSNGFLPSKYLETNSIKEPVDFPSGLEVSNLTTPSDLMPCPDRQNFLWSLISHLTLSYSTLADADTLKNILSLYNWSQDYNNPEKKKIQAISKIHPPKTKNIFRNRGLVRGIEFKIEIDGEQFEHGEGDIHLFGLVLSRFLSQYVTINSFVILTIIEIGTNKRYTWQPNLGKILPV